MELQVLSIVHVLPFLVAIYPSTSGCGSEAVVRLQTTGFVSVQCWKHVGTRRHSHCRGGMLKMAALCRAKVGGMGRKGPVVGFGK